MIECFMSLLGWKTDKEIDYINEIEYLRKLLSKKDKEISVLKKEKKIFKLCDLQRGKRYNEIVFPRDMDEFTEWIHTDLLPTLGKDGFVTGDAKFYKR